MNMKLIEKLFCMIDEEIKDAMEYAKCALAYKDKNSFFAEIFIRLLLYSLFKLMVQDIKQKLLTIYLHILQNRYQKLKI